MSMPRDDKEGPICGGFVLVVKGHDLRVVPGLPIADNHSNFHLKTTIDHIEHNDAHLKTFRQVCTSTQ